MQKNWCERKTDEKEKKDAKEKRHERKKDAKVKKEDKSSFSATKESRCRAKSLAGLKIVLLKIVHVVQNQVAQGPSVSKEKGLTW